MDRDVHGMNTRHVASAHNLYLPRVSGRVSKYSLRREHISSRTYPGLDATQILGHRICEAPTCLDPPLRSTGHCCRPGSSVILLFDDELERDPSPARGQFGSTQIFIFKIPRYRTLIIFSDWIGERNYSVDSEGLDSTPTPAFGTLGAPMNGC